MTTSSKTIAIKKSENGNAKSTERVKVEFKPKASLEETKKMLEDQISIFQQKAKLIANKELFELKRNQMLDFLQEEGTDYDDSLDSRNLILILGDNNHYNENGRVKISNNLIINQMLRNVLVQMNTKITELEQQILS